MDENLSQDHQDNKETTLPNECGTDVEDAAVLPLNRLTASRLSSTFFFRSICRRTRWVLTALGALMLGATAIAYVIDARTNIILPDPALWLPLVSTEGLAVLLGWGACVGLGALNRRQEAFIDLCISRLAALHDTRDLNTLLLFKQIEFPAVQRVIVERLTAITDTIQFGEDRCLSAETWRRLLDKIEADWWVESSALGVAIIRMLARTRDPGANDIVRRYTKPGAWLVAGESVRATARECLPALESALQEQKQRETLLRASGPVSESAQELLRAASAANSNPPELLLRPSASSDRTL